MSKKIIGFANQFYTLWEYSKSTQYVTDAYGTSHPIREIVIYTYIKNISTDLSKVESLYPSTTIDLQLRGSRSFELQSQIDRPKGYFWGGKYAGKLIDDIINCDFNYCLWSIENYKGDTFNHITNHPKYIQYLQDIENERNAKLSRARLLKVGEVAELQFVTNGYNFDIYEGDNVCWANAYIEDNNKVCIELLGKSVGGMYPYVMPIINGKPQRTKGKSIYVTIAEVINVRIENDEVVQCVRVN
jgi:hypothetical protein